MTTNPEVLRLAEETARRLLVDKVCAEARQRFMNDATCPTDMTEHLIRVAGEHAAIAAIERTAQLSKGAACNKVRVIMSDKDAAWNNACVTLAEIFHNFDHLRQSEKDKSDAD